MFFFAAAFTLYAQESTRTIINIENARRTTYESDKETGDDLVVLEGDVRISVSRGADGTVITADKVTYNRTTEMLYADGSIKFNQTSGDASGGLDLTATSLLFNTRTLEGFFDDGRVVQTQSNAINLPSGSTLIVISDLFGRSESNTITFKKGELTFCDEPDPHWKIKASRIWLLPGGEFAFLNALLYVGNVPILYLPAFYYPKDELIFNPVFGYRQREGYFIQTTTYLVGRKPLDAYAKPVTGDSGSDAGNQLQGLFNFMRPTKLKEQKREGIVLHNLDKDFTGSTSHYVKLMLDWYSNLGFGVGVAGNYKPSDKPISIDGSLMLGFSSTIFNDNGIYTVKSASGKTYRDSSNFMGMYLPFRYQADFKMSLSRPFSLSLSMPLYSDPYFNDDYLKNRNESMDWISFLLQTASNSNEEQTDTKNEVTSFSWNLNSSYSVPLPDVVKPYINNISLSLTSSMNFSTKTIDKNDWSASALSDALNTYSPSRKFYYPSQITPANISTSINGTVFSYPLKQKTYTPKYKERSFVVNLQPPDDLKTEKELAGVDSTDDADDADGAAGENIDAVQSDDNEIGPLLPDTSLPNLTFGHTKNTPVEPFTYSLNYSFTPSYTPQFSYASEPLHSANDIDLTRLRSSMYIVRMPIELSSNAAVAGTFFTSRNTFSFSPVFQGHPDVSTAPTTEGGYTPSQIASLREADYRASRRDITNTNNISLRPISFLSNFKETGVTWRSSVKLFRREFVGTAADPKWDYLGADWDSTDSITENALDFSFVATEGYSNEFRQSIVVTMKLPPQTDEYDGTLTLSFPHVSASLSTGIVARTGIIVTGESKWRRKPVNQSFTFTIFEKNPLSFSQSYTYDFEDYHHDNLQFSLSWGGLRAAYTMMYTRGYDFNSDSSKGSLGYNQRSDSEFLPYSFSLSYTMSSKTLKTKSEKLSWSPGISTSIVADLLRPTNTTFLLSPSMTFIINGVLSLSFSATIKNSVIYRYFQKAIGGDIKIPGEENMFVDLFNSFRFDNDEYRKSSGFKLQSLDFSFTHDLHDWDLRATVKVEPRLVTENGKSYYDMKPLITFSVVWRPMDSMKVEIRDKYGDWQLNP